MVGRRRRGRAPLPEAPVDVRADHAETMLAHGAGARRLGRARRRVQGGAPRAPSRAEAGELRLRAHPVQHGRVGRHEDAERARGARRPMPRRRSAELVREGLSHPAARALSRSCRTSRGRCGTISASPRSTATSSTRRGREVDAAALAQDEIELVLQVNGKLRGKLTVPSNADHAAIETRGARKRRGRQARRRRGGRRRSSSFREGSSMSSSERKHRVRPASACRSTLAGIDGRCLRASSDLVGLVLMRACRAAASTCAARSTTRSRRSTSTPRTSPPFARAMKRALEGAASAQARRQPPPTAQVVLDITSVVDDKDVLSLSGGGRVREYLLIKRVTFRLHDNDGQRLAARGRGRRPPHATRSTKPRCSRAKSQEQTLSGARCRPTPCSRSCAACRRRRSRRRNRRAHLVELCAAPARRASRAQARAALRRPRRRAAAGDRSRRRDPRRGAPRRLRRARSAGRRARLQLGRVSRRQRQLGLFGERKLIDLRIPVGQARRRGRARRSRTCAGASERRRRMYC